jgi:hypothetical protein
MMLMQLGALVTMTDKNGYNASALAELNGHFDIVDKFELMGSSPVHP